MSEASESDDSRFPDQLVEGLARGRVIPFVGSGVSYNVNFSEDAAHPWEERYGAPAIPEGAKIGKPFPLWDGLLWRLVHYMETELSAQEQADDAKKNLEGEDSDVLKAANEIRRILSDNQQLDRVVEDALVFDRERLADESLDLARAVWELNPWNRLVITTNYDHVLDWVCPTDLEPEIAALSSSQALDELNRERPDRPTVWHLHGRVGTEDPLVLAPEDYRQLYGGTSEARARRYEGALRKLRFLLEDKHLLFVGFSLTDKFFLRELDLVKSAYRIKPPKHFALVNRSKVGEFESIREEYPFLKLVVFEDFGSPHVEALRELHRSAKEVRQDEGFVRQHVAGDFKRRIEETCRYAVSTGGFVDERFERIDGLIEEGCYLEAKQEIDSVAETLGAEDAGAQREPKPDKRREFMRQIDIRRSVVYARMREYDESYHFFQPLMPLRGEVSADTVARAAEVYLTLADQDIDVEGWDSILLAAEQTGHHELMTALHAAAFVQTEDRLGSAPPAFAEEPPTERFLGLNAGFAIELMTEGYFQLAWEWLEPLVNYREDWSGQTPFFAIPMLIRHWPEGKAAPESGWKKILTTVRERILELREKYPAGEKEYARAVFLRTAALFHFLLQEFADFRFYLDAWLECGEEAENSEELRAFLNPDGGTEPDLLIPAAGEDLGIRAGPVVGYMVQFSSDDRWREEAEQFENGLSRDDFEPEEWLQEFGENVTRMGLGLALGEVLEDDQPRGAFLPEVAERVVDVVRRKVYEGGESQKLLDYARAVVRGYPNMTAMVVHARAALWGSEEAEARRIVETLEGFETEDPGLVQLHAELARLDGRPGDAGEILIQEAKGRPRTVRGELVYRSVRSFLEADDFESAEKCIVEALTADLLGRGRYRALCVYWRWRWLRYSPGSSKDERARAGLKNILMNLADVYPKWQFPKMMAFHCQIFEFAGPHVAVEELGIGQMLDLGKEEDLAWIHETRKRGREIAASARRLQKHGILSFGAGLERAGIPPLAYLMAGAEADNEIPDDIPRLYYDLGFDHPDLSGSTPILRVEELVLTPSVMRTLAILSPDISPSEILAGLSAEDIRLVIPGWCIEKVRDEVEKLRQKIKNQRILGEIESLEQLERGRVQIEDEIAEVTREQLADMFGERRDWTGVHLRLARARLDDAWLLDDHFTDLKGNAVIEGGVRDQLNSAQLLDVLHRRVGVPKPERTELKRRLREHLDETAEYIDSPPPGSTIRTSVETLTKWHQAGVLDSFYRSNFELVVDGESAAGIRNKRRLYDHLEAAHRHLVEVLDAVETAQNRGHLHIDGRWRDGDGDSGQLKDGVVGAAEIAESVLDRGGTLWTDDAVFETVAGRTPVSPIWSEVTEIETDQFAQLRTVGTWEVLARCGRNSARVARTLDEHGYYGLGREYEVAGDLVSEFGTDTLAPFRKRIEFQLHDVPERLLEVGVPESLMRTYDLRAVGRFLTGVCTAEDFNEEDPEEQVEFLRELLEYAIEQVDETVRDGAVTTILSEMLSYIASNLLSVRQEWDLHEAQKIVRAIIEVGDDCGGSVTSALLTVEKLLLVLWNSESVELGFPLDDLVSPAVVQVFGPFFGRWLDDLVVDWAILTYELPAFLQTEKGGDLVEVSSLYEQFDGGAGEKLDFSPIQKERWITRTVGEGLFWLGFENRLLREDDEVAEVVPFGLSKFLVAMNGGEAADRWKERISEGIEEAGPLLREAVELSSQPVRHDDLLSKAQASPLRRVLADPQQVRVFERADWHGFANFFGMSNIDVGANEGSLSYKEQDAWDESEETVRLISRLPGFAFLEYPAVFSQLTDRAEVGFDQEFEFTESRLEYFGRPWQTAVSNPTYSMFLSKALETASRLTPQNEAQSERFAESLQTHFETELQRLLEVAMGDAAITEHWLLNLQTVAYQAAGAVALNIAENNGWAEQEAGNLKLLLAGVRLGEWLSYCVLNSPKDVSWLHARLQRVIRRREDPAGTWPEDLFNPFLWGGGGEKDCPWALILHLKTLQLLEELLPGEVTVMPVGGGVREVVAEVAESNLSVVPGREVVQDSGGDMLGCPVSGSPSELAAALLDGRD